jgi:catechol 2,3-dioxygenase-like lactoylglutathione lyase family enzyme
VANIDDALTLFVDTLGFQLVHRAPARDVSAESAVLDGGSVVLTLIQPVGSDGPAFPDPSPRLSQLIVEVDDIDAASADVAQAGLSVQVADEANSFVTPAAMEGVVGFPMALVFRASQHVQGPGSSEDAATE